MHKLFNINRKCLQSDGCIVPIATAGNLHIFGILAKVLPSDVVVAVVLVSVAGVDIICAKLALPLFLC